MGIIVPRPAMRRREERTLKSNLQKHCELTQLIHESGATSKDASNIAYKIVTTSAARKRIWRKK